MSNKPEETKKPEGVQGQVYELVRFLLSSKFGWDKKNGWYGRIVTDNGLRYATHSRRLAHVLSSMWRNRHRVST